MIKYSLKNKSVLKRIKTINMEKNKTEDYRIEALRAASTLKHETVQELLTDADRIEKWLLEPVVKA